MRHHSCMCASSMFPGTNLLYSMLMVCIEKIAKVRHVRISGACKYVGARGCPYGFVELTGFGGIHSRSTTSAPWSEGKARCLMGIESSSQTRGSTFPATGRNDHPSDTPEFFRYSLSMRSKACGVPSPVLAGPRNMGDQVIPGC